MYIYIYVLNSIFHIAIFFKEQILYVVHMCNLYKPQSQRESSQAYPLDTRSVSWYPKSQVLW